MHTRIHMQDTHVSSTLVCTQAGTDVNAVQEDGYTALMVCAHYGHAALVHLLLQVRHGREVMSGCSLSHWHHDTTGTFIIQNTKYIPSRE